VGKKAKHKKGAKVVGMLGAQRFSRVASAQVQPAAALPGSTPTDALGRLGISGLTAWVGVAAVTKPPKKGDVVIVSAAAGATGSMAAQFAKARGARVIGVAGGPAKCAFLTEKLGLDGSIDYKRSNETLGAQLDRLAPDGVDFFFDNVGGDILDAVLPRMRRKGRIVLCGGIAHYGKGDVNKGTVKGPSQYLKLAEKGASMHGYNVMFYLPAKLPAFLWQMLWLIWKRKVVMYEHVEKGLGRFAIAMESMFKGGNTGKMLVQVAEEASA